ncbi:MAG TPA: hypothetical protein VLI04_11155 [Nocardioidaceae bacterium]|nr:hypothetical protein [Nocardioidaceae bacterium]
MFGKPVDALPPLDQALDSAASLKPGTWESVETLSMLAVEAKGRPDAQGLYESALSASKSLRPGSWESVRALTWLARAERELHNA